MLAVLDGGDNSLKVLLQEACADHWGQSNALNVHSTAEMLNTVIEVLAFSPCLSIGHCKKYNFHKLIQPYIPDKHGFKLIFSPSPPLFFFFEEEEEGSNKESIGHWYNQAQERKTEPLQQKVALKRMVNTAVSQYTGPVLPGLSFSS